MDTPDIVVPEFGSVVTAGKIEEAPLGLAGIVTTLVVPRGTVITLFPGSVVVIPLGPPTSVVVITLGLGDCALAGMLTTLDPPAGTVTTLDPPGRVVVTPD